MPHSTPRSYFVYILSSERGVLYVGVTNDLQRRLAEHQQGKVESFTIALQGPPAGLLRGDGRHTICPGAREQIKSWRREKKLALIREANPKFEDLSAGLA